MFSAGRAKIAKIASIDLDAIFGKIIPELGDDMIRANQDQLFEQGVQADNTLTGNYAPETIARKDKLGQRTDHITLSDTGEFYESMKITPKTDGVVIEADTIKIGVGTDDLLDRWPKALGLSSDSIDELRPKVADLMLDEIKKEL